MPGMHLQCGQGHPRITFCWKKITSLGKKKMSVSPSRGLFSPINPKPQCHNLSLFKNGHRLVTSSKLANKTHMERPRKPHQCERTLSAHEVSRILRTGAGKNFSEMEAEKSCLAICTRLMLRRKEGKTKCGSTGSDLYKLLPACRGSALWGTPWQLFCDRPCQTHPPFAIGCQLSLHFLRR